MNRLEYCDGLDFSWASLKKSITNMHGSDTCNPKHGQNNPPVLHIGTDFDGISDGVWPVLLKNKTLS